MSNPDVGDVHVNALLTNMSIGYKPAGFFADRVFPVVPVNFQTDIYPVYNKSFWARDLGAPGAAPTGSFQAVRRSPGTKARTTGFTIDNTNTYRCVNYALGFEIPFELRRNANSVFNLDRDAQELLNALLRLRFDREFVSDFITNDPGWGTLTISNKWSDYTASTPVEDLRAGLTTLRRNTLGMTAEGGIKLLIGALVEQRILDHPDLLDRIKYGGSNGAPAKVTLEALAALLGIDEVIVAKSVYTDSEEGTAEASASYSDVCSDDVLMYYAPPGASQLKPSAGYLFNWAGSAGGLTYVRSGEETRERYDWIEVHGYLDWVTTALASGVINADAVD